MVQPITGPVQVYALPGMDWKRIACCLAGAVAGRGGTEEDARRSYADPLPGGVREIAGPPNPTAINQMQSPTTAERAELMQRAGEAGGTKEGARLPYAMPSQHSTNRSRTSTAAEEMEGVVWGEGDRGTAAAAHSFAAIVQLQMPTMAMRTGMI